MKKIILILCLISFSFSSHAANSIIEKAARFNFSKKIMLQIEGESGTLNLQKMTDENVKQVILDLKKSNDRFERLSNIYISDDGIILGLAQIRGDENPVLFMFLPDSHQPSVFRIQDVIADKIVLEKGLAEVLRN